MSESLSGRPRSEFAEVNRAIEFRFEVPKEQITELLHDHKFVAKARLLLHEQMGACSSADPERCYDTHHRVRIDAHRFLERLFSQEPYSMQTCAECGCVAPEHRFNCSQQHAYPGRTE